MVETARPWIRLTQPESCFGHKLTVRGRLLREGLGGEVVT